jgi:citrate lyase subunit beta/citryl-CoA lyase
MTIREPDLRRTWLFGPGGDDAAHAAMLASGADALILDLEDFTVPARRPAARAGLAASLARWRAAGVVTSVRINALDGDGPEDLAAAMAAGADVIAYPMAARAADIRALDGLIAYWEGQLGRPVGGTEILPVCETALGVVAVGALAAVSPRVRCALLGTEDLAADLAAERTAEGIELAYARQRFLLECRAAGIEPIDAPYTFRDAEGARREAEQARRLGYRSKSLVLPEHAAAINAALTPDTATVARAMATVQAFEAARARGEDRALVDGLWVEVPTWRSAKRLVARAERLGVVPSG